MCFRDFAHEREAKAHAVGACGDKRVENMLRFRCADAGSAVAHEKTTTVVGTFRAECDVAAARRMLDRVQQKIFQRTRQAFFVEFPLRFACRQRLEREVNTGFTRVRLQSFEPRAQERLQPNWAGLNLACACEQPQRT